VDLNIPSRWSATSSSDRVREVQRSPQTFIDGIADWEAKEPGVKKQMVIVSGFSPCAGRINKLPGVDYHV